ncbi:MAG TPA: N-acyl homoserine lactonase family protein [Anaeromyxobacteraceae bacterium]|nr:N-acyl homoserine lactonase family protein [Anaeromyxobacteraceae bacterium]
MTAPDHEVYAIRYAVHERRAGENFHLRVVDRPMPMDYFVWLVRGGGRTLVVDTGFGEEAADRRQRRLLRSPVEGLRALGVEAATVEDVVLTHLHYDHAGNLGAFEKARFHLQAAEMTYASGPAMAHAPLGGAFDAEDVAAMVRRVFAGRVRFHDGDTALFPGVTLHRIGGHTRGLQAVSVTTARGLVVLASDASHYWANLTERNPFPIFVDLEAMMTGWDRLRALAPSLDHLVPGHDPAVLARFPHPPGQPDIACLHLPPVGA